MGLFSGLGQLGLGRFENTDIIQKSEPKGVTRGQGQEQAAEQPVKTPEEKETECLYDKRYTCPVCDMNFTAKAIRSGKVKLIGKDTDLRPIYEDVDLIKYDAVTCEMCGYSALTRYFGHLSMRQIKDIHDQIGMRFSGIDTNKALYSYDDAITRYKLALLSSVVKKASNSERAYTSMKLAWVLRGKRTALEKGKEKKEKEVRQLQTDETECIQNAYDGFVAAMANEAFPIAGMDENTLMYIVAEFARRLGKYDECMRLLSQVLTAPSSPPRLKDQALMIKELLKKDIKKG